MVEKKTASPQKRVEAKGRKPAAKKKAPEPEWSFGPFETYTEVETPAGVFGLSSGEVVRAWPHPEIRGGFQVEIGRF